MYSGRVEESTVGSTVERGTVCGSAFSSWYVRNQARPALREADGHPDRDGHPYRQMEGKPGRLVSYPEQFLRAVEVALPPLVRPTSH
jgi:hypothetical protein